MPKQNCVYCGKKARYEVIFMRNEFESYKGFVCGGCNSRLHLNGKYAGHPDDENIRLFDELFKKQSGGD